jgi:hypothetical protein
MPFINVIYECRTTYNREVARVARSRRGWDSLSKDHKEIAIRQDNECLAAAMELALTQRTLNIHLWQVEFHNNREGTLGGLRKSAPKSETDFAQLAHNARMLQAGQHPSQVDSPRAARPLASGPLPSGEPVQQPHLVGDDAAWSELRTPVAAVPHRPTHMPRGQTTPGKAHFVPASALRNKSTPLRKARVPDEDDLIEFSSSESPSPPPSRSRSRGRH